MIILRTPSQSQNCATSDIMALRASQWHYFDGTPAMSWTAPAKRSDDGAFGRTAGKRGNKSLRAHESGVALRFPPQSMMRLDMRSVPGGRTSSACNRQAWLPKKCGFKLGSVPYHSIRARANLSASPIHRVRSNYQHTTPPRRRD